MKKENMREMEKKRKDFYLLSFFFLFQFFFCFLFELCFCFSLHGFQFEFKCVWLKVGHRGRGNNDEVRAQRRIRFVMRGNFDKRKGPLNRQCRIFFLFIFLLFLVSVFRNQKRHCFEFISLF